MGLERCPECGHLTHVYADAGTRSHNPGCSLTQPVVVDRYAMAVSLLTVVSFANPLPPPEGGYAIGEATMTAIRLFLAQPTTYQERTQ